MPRRPYFAVALAALAIAAGAAAPSAQAAIGDLTLPADPLACFNDLGTEGCTDVRGASQLKPVTLSPDGAQLYASSLDGLVVFDRAADGTLTQKPGAAGCYVASAKDGCQLVNGQDNATDAVVSPDGQHVYATSSFADSVVIYDRAPDGSLSRKPVQAGCIADIGSIGCADGRALDLPVGVAMSADGATVYVVTQGTNDGIAVFDRNPDGTLTQKAGAAGCVTQDGSEGCTDGRNFVNPNTLLRVGSTLYATGTGLSVLDIGAGGALTQKAGLNGCVNESGSDGCATGRALSTVIGPVASADGTRIYAPAQLDSAITVFDRAPNGVITQRAAPEACLVDAAEAAIPGCLSVGRAMDAVKGASLSPDGAQLYAVGQTSDSVVVFDVGADGNLTQRAGGRGCLTQAALGDCAVARGLGGPGATVMAPDGRRLYTGGSTLAAFVRQVDPDPPTPPAPPAPVDPPVLPPAGPGDPVVPVALCNRPLTLLDVLPRGRTKVHITGIARSSFAGRRVVLREGTRRVGSAVVRADGRFSAVVSAPPKARRASARYTATITDGPRSQAFKLSRSFTILSRRNVAGGVRVVVRLEGRNRSRDVRVQRQTSCTERRNVAKGRIDKRGRVTFVLPRPTDPADPVAIYRVRARVNTKLSFTLQVAVERAG